MTTHSTERSRQVVVDAVALANVWRIEGRWHDALKLLGGLAPIVAAGDARLGTMVALARGQVLIEQDGFGGVDTLAERTAALDTALSLAEQTGDQALLGAVWDARGMSQHYVFLNTGRTSEPPDELASFERGLALRRAANDLLGIAESLFHLGMFYGVVRSDHQQALAPLRESYDLATRHGDLIMASYAIRHIAFVHHDQGDIPAAHANLQESLALREQAGFVPGIAMALVMLAFPERELGNQTTALDHLVRARAIFHGLGAESKVTWVDDMINDFQQPA